MINLFIKFSQPNKYSDFLDLFKNSTILSLPSFFGIGLALIAIPIHLQTNGKADYGNYIFFHFIISFGLLLNFGINKIVAIEVAKKKFLHQIIKQSLNISILIAFLILLIQIIFSVYFDNLYYYSLFGIGVSLTIFYLTLEGILQGLRKFKLLSLVNFIFYTLSLNTPSILLFTENNFKYQNLILISILIKIVSIFIILFFLKSFLIKEKKKKYNFLSKISKYSKWYFVHLSNLQIYDFVDKYLIKLFIGPISLAIYSIPYQLAGKITIFSKSIAAVLLPEISYKNQVKNFNYSIQIYVFFVPIILLSIFPFIDKLLFFWLQDQYSIEILYLTKIFLIVAWISGISHLTIVYFEGKKQIKFNTLLELYFIFPFLGLLLLTLFHFKSLFYIALILLFKEFVLLIFRTQKIKNEITSILLIYVNLIIVISSCLISIYYEEYFFYFYVFIIIFNFMLIFKKIKI